MFQLFIILLIVLQNGLVLYAAWVWSVYCNCTSIFDCKNGFRILYRTHSFVNENTLYTEKEAVAIYSSSVQELFKKFAKLMSDYLSSQKSFAAAETGK